MTTSVAGDGHDPAPDTDPELALAHLRRFVRQLIANAVTDHYLDPNQAETILRACGVPPHPRQHTVRLTIIVDCQVNAADAATAITTAEGIIEIALDNAPVPIHIDWPAGYRTAKPTNIDD